MKTYWIDFSASYYISAENEEEAKEKFWKYFGNSKCLDYVEINLVEEDKDVD